MQESARGASPPNLGALVGQDRRERPGWVAPTSRPTPARGDVGAIGEGPAWVNEALTFVS
jgi:hypothetical protein